MMKKHLSGVIALILTINITLMGFIGDKAFATPKKSVSQIESTMTLATTTSTKDSGLLDYLIPLFEKKYNTSVKVVSVGSGEAIEMGKRGDADVLLVHSRKAEDAFIRSGFGINRKDVMHNDFFIVGPKNDPANISDTKTASEALMKIADAKITFISRADKSGTNTKELSLWPKTVKTKGQAWYLEAGLGMGETLMMAAEKGAYTLTDSATWYAFENKLNLKVLVQGEKNLLNPYGVIAVSPLKYRNIHFKAAMAFTKYLISAEGQKAIAAYKSNGHQLFFPDVVK
jgi:tungstate transport system substrate-binding protein